MKKAIIILGIIIVGGMMMMSCPDQEAHKKTIMNDFKTAFNESAAESELGVFGVLAGPLVSGIVDLYVNQYLTVNNYLFVSVGKIQNPETGEQWTASIGVFNHVFSFIDKDKVKEALNE